MNAKAEAAAPDTYEAMAATDKQRISLLELSRETSPVSTVLRVDKLGRTVIPKLLKQPVQWAVLLVYASTAACRRAGVDFGVIDADAFSGAGTMVTFMIIFYVGYCYKRYEMYFNEVQHIMLSIHNSVSFS